MLPPCRNMKLEMPETRPFWSGQETSKVAVSGMVRVLAFGASPPRLCPTESCRALPGGAGRNTRPYLGGCFGGLLPLNLFPLNPGVYLFFQDRERQGAV